MKKRILALILLTCLILGACGNSADSNDAIDAEETETNTETEETEESDSNSETAEEKPLRIYTVNKIGQLDPADATEEILSAGYNYAGRVDMGVASDTVYRFFSVESDLSENDTLFCIQTLQPPYTEWENHIIAPEEWVEGESCKAYSATLTDYGEIHVFLEGTENNYVGRWSLSKGCSARDFECDYQIFNNEVWFAGDEIGNYIITNNTDYASGIMHNYEMFWLDSQFQPKEGLPDPTVGYVWAAAETPISGTTYLFGCDANGVEIGTDSMTIYNTGFSIWEPGADVPVFTTPNAGMSIGETAFFYSETEGYLFTYGGIWEFSIKDQSITNIKNNSIFWRDACLRNDDSALMISSYYNQETGNTEYYLWEMLIETADAS